MRSRMVRYTSQSTSSPRIPQPSMKHSSYHLPPKHPHNQIRYLRYGPSLRPTPCGCDCVSRRLCPSFFRYMVMTFVWRQSPINPHKSTIMSSSAQQLAIRKTFLEILPPAPLSIGGLCLLPCLLPLSSSVRFCVVTQSFGTCGHP